MLKDKVAVITGSTSGIGLGIARGFAKEGVKVVLNGLGNAADIEQTRAELESSTGTEVIFNGADMTQPDQIVAMLQQAKSTFGSVDIIVNNAGIQKVAPIEEFPVDKWDAIIAINLTSAFHTIRTVVPWMKANRWGRIINIASAHALVASPFKSAYVTAKHGLLGLTKTVALELAEHGITCNAICPGYVFTPLVEGQVKDTAKARNLTEEQVIRDVLLAAQSTKQFVTVEQLSALTVFLCSDDAAQITGTALPMDGGWTAH
jgi:3-hydroxybutyrate dehydrogenase